MSWAFTFHKVLTFHQLLFIFFIWVSVSPANEREREIIRKNTHFLMLWREKTKMKRLDGPLKEYEKSPPSPSTTRVAGKEWSACIIFYEKISLCLEKGRERLSQLPLQYLVTMRRRYLLGHMNCLYKLQFY